LVSVVVSTAIGTIKVCTVVVATLSSVAIIIGLFAVSTTAKFIIAGISEITTEVIGILVAHAIALASLSSIAESVVSVSTVGAAILSGSLVVAGYTVCNVSVVFVALGLCIIGATSVALIIGLTS